MMRASYFYLRLKLLICFIVLSGGSFLHANDFRHVDWNELTFDEGLPTYVASVDLGMSASDISAYDVRIVYPEYIELADKAIIKKYKDELQCLTDTIHFNKYVSVSRKRGSLCIDFIPLIRKDKRYYKLVSFKLAVTPKRMGVRSLSTVAKKSNGQTRYTDKSVLSEGRWVKIRVEKEGIHQLTRKALASMGFSDPSKVRLFGYGGLLQHTLINYDGDDRDYDDLEEVPLYTGTNGLLFYAEGCVRWSGWSYDVSSGTYRSNHTNNPYSRYAYYFLTEGTPMNFPVETDIPAGGSEWNTFYDRVVYEEDAYSWYSSGRKFYDSYDFIQGNTKSFRVATPNLNDSKPASVKVAFSAGNASATSVQVEVNGSSSVKKFAVPAVLQYEHAREEVATFASTDLISGENQIKITTTAGRNARLDYIEVNYLRDLKLTASSLLFSSHLSSTRSQTFVVSGANTQTRVWRVGKAGSPTTELAGTLENGEYYVPVLPVNGQRYVAVNINGSFPSPQFVEVVENQNLHDKQIYDYVMIVPKSGKLMAEAQRLADAHTERSGLRVKVVRADQIYNEFSSGTPDATAYRRYLKMLYDRAANEKDMPRYLLLFGDGAWDNRMVTSAWRNYSPDDFLLCYESENSLHEVSSYATDDYFGFLDDGEGNFIESRDRLDVGIGRFPVRSVSEARLLVDKTIAYMDNVNAGSWQNLICMLGDDGDNNEHMIDADSVANPIERSYKNLHVKRYYWDAYERVSSATGNTYPQVTRLLKEQMNKGALVMNYSGHGAPATISHEKVLNLSDFANFSSANVPLWVVASCEITPFDMQMETIGETAVLQPKGSAIAFLGASRAVFSRPNRYINKLFMRYVLGRDEDGIRYRLGDALRLAKDSLIVGNGECKDLTYNKLKYALMGDPAVTLAVPEHRLVVDQINGVDVSAGHQVVLPAGSVVRVNGYVESVQGGKMESFQGAVTATMFDAEEVVTCRNQAGADEAFVYKDRTRTLFEGTDSVRQGRFSLEIPISHEINYTESTGLISLYAVSEDRQLTANGRFDNFVFEANATLPTDSAGPEIYLYLNTPEFVDGGKVNSTPYFVAHLSDEDGINVSGNGIGHDLELIIDGNETTSYVLNNYYSNDFGSYQSGTVQYSIPTLTAGKHQLLFRAWDMSGNSSSRVLNFVVEPGLRPSLLNLVCYPNPASDVTTIVMNSNRLATNVICRIQVYDCHGRCVWQQTLTNSSLDGYFRTEWNLTSTGGAKLPAGIYFVRANVATEDGRSGSKTDKLIILGNK